MQSLAVITVIEWMENWKTHWKKIPILNTTSTMASRPNNTLIVTALIIIITIHSWQRFSLSMWFKSLLMNNGKCQHIIVFVSMERSRSCTHKSTVHVIHHTTHVLEHAAKAKEASGSQLLLLLLRWKCSHLTRSLDTQQATRPEAKGVAKHLVHLAHVLPVTTVYRRKINEPYSLHLILHCWL